MKKRGKMIKFYRNPAPLFSATLINKAKKHKKAAKKMRTRNAVKPFAKKAKVKKRHRNPLQVVHSLVDLPQSNPVPMKTKKRSRRRRNSVRPFKRGRSTHRSTRRHRNPPRRHRKKGFMRRRNPVAIVSDFLSTENLGVAAGALVGVVGSKWLINTLLTVNTATGEVPFKLPGVTYPTTAAPMTPAQFAEKNKWALAFYETLLPAVAGYFLKGHAPKLSKGLMLAAPINAGIALLKQTDIGTRAGLNMYLRTSIPGVPPQLSGPATAWINNGSPATRGMAARVDASWLNNTASGAVNPFATTN